MHRGGAAPPREPHPLGNRSHNLPVSIALSSGLTNLLQLRSPSQAHSMSSLPFKSVAWVGVAHLALVSTAGSDSPSLLAQEGIYSC